MDKDAIEFRGIPTFRIANYEKAKEFYVDLLGFNIDWEHRFGSEEPVYMQVSKNGLILHLSENERFKTGVIIVVETKGIDKFQKELYEHSSSSFEVSTTNWGTKQMEVEDPFGNLLRFNENLQT